MFVLHRELETVIVFEQAITLAARFQAIESSPADSSHPLGYFFARRQIDSIALWIFRNVCKNK